MNNVIKVNIKNRYDYVSKYNDNILSKDLSNYIMDECKSFNIKEDFCIKITSDYDIGGSEKENIASMIRSNFGTELSELIEKRKITLYMDAIILFFGIITLVFYLLSSNIPILSEIILVISWMLVGESFFNLIFTGFSNKIDMLRRKKLVNCKIIFE